ncbi:unnamed protein product, partial [Prorocentrum cordatum]
GDPWSPLALTAVLAGPLFEAQAAAPRAEFTLFVDDRTWTAPTLTEHFRAAEVWREWTSVLGVKESEGKQQWAAAAPSKRRQLLQHGVPADRVHDKLKALGMRFTGGPKRAEVDREKKRVEKALQQARRAKLLPLQPRDQRTLLASRKLVQGHGLDVAYQAQKTTVMAAVRIAAKTRPSTTPTRWKRGRGWGGNVAAMLKTTGWALTGEWAWYHAGLDKRICLDRNSRKWLRPKALAHVLREGWRHACFVQGQRATRIDSGLCRWESYEPCRIKAVQTAAANSRKAAAFLTGAFVPVAALDNSRAQRAAQAADEAQQQPQPREEGTRTELAPCRWCGAPVPDTDHML